MHFLSIPVDVIMYIFYSAYSAYSDNWGGGGAYSLYLCYAQLISFEIEILKSIVFTVCEQEYMNMCPPPPPNYRSSGIPEFNLQKSIVY